MKTIELTNCTIEYGDNVRLWKSTDGKIQRLYMPYKGFVPVNAETIDFEFSSRQYGVSTKRIVEGTEVIARQHTDNHNGLVIVTRK